MTEALFTDLQKIVGDLKRTIEFKNVEINKLKIKNSERAVASSEEDRLLIKELRHQLAAKDQMIRSLCIDSAEQETLLEAHGVVMHDGYSNIGIEGGIAQLIATYEARLLAVKNARVPDKLAGDVRIHQEPDEFPGPYVVRYDSGRYVMEDKAGNILIWAFGTDSHLQLAADCINFVSELVLAPP